jgi:uncharacterized heparinase superfamily protein
MAEAIAVWGAADAGSVTGRAAEVLAGRFSFLNHYEELISIDWTHRYVSHLWSYNLHYFDYALDLAWAYRMIGDPRFARGFSQLATDWIEQSSSGRGDGWEPYALSIRSVNWMFALLLLGDALDAEPREAIASSIFRQLSVLSKRLETHLLANHYQKNLQALAIGGLFFDCPRAEIWRRKSANALWREFEVQFKEDGCHFERSPMYHAIALVDLLQVIHLYQGVGERVPQSVIERAGMAARAYRFFSRPDGTLHLVNDSANGIAPPRPYINRLAEMVLGLGGADPEGVVSLPDAGFAGYVNRATGERFIWDCGEIGPSYQPAHAHSGLLGFELDLAGQPLVVDSGVHGYGGDPLREYVRSTRAHNTIMIGKREQSEMWGVHRVGRRARVKNTATADTVGIPVFEGAYSPYHSRSTIHRRQVIRRGDREWIVNDSVEGSRGASVESFLHLHPSLNASLADGKIAVITEGIRVVIEPFGVDAISVVSGELEPAQGWYCPEFGRAIAAPTVIMRVHRNRGTPFGYHIRRVAAGS